MKEKIKSYISDWQRKCYNEGIPDEAPVRLEQLNKVPSYKSIVRAILKNDTSLKTLGFNQVKCSQYHELKRIELQQRETKSNQLEIWHTKSKS